LPDDMSTTREEPHDGRRPPWSEIGRECVEFWRRMPDKAAFFVLFVAWVVLFHFLGNSTLGYTRSHSLFGWAYFVYSTNGQGEDIGMFVPLVVLALVYWKRKVLLEVPKAPWWPAIFLLAGALVLHGVGYFVQQTRLSIVAFFLGLYAIMGLVWGRRWLAAIFFPFIVFAFCLPLSSEAEAVTLQMRLWATSITSAIGNGLGIGLIQDGTRIFDQSGRFQYEVAAACSGIRSLTATLMIAVVYAFVSFRNVGRRLLLILSAFPLAIIANVFRLTMIIVTAEAFGQSAGDFVHKNPFLSLLPYLPVFVGLALLGRLLREQEGVGNSAGPHLQPAA
jgi:exosortase